MEKTGKGEGGASWAMMMRGGRPDDFLTRTSAQVAALSGRIAQCAEPGSGVVDLFDPEHFAHVARRGREVFVGAHLGVVCGLGAAYEGARSPGDVVSFAELAPVVVLEAVRAASGDVAGLGAVFGDSGGVLGGPVFVRHDVLGARVASEHARSLVVHLSCVGFDLALRRATSRRDQSVAVVSALAPFPRLGSSFLGRCVLPSPAGRAPFLRAAPSGTRGSAWP